MDKEYILKVGKSLKGKKAYHEFLALSAEIKNLISASSGKNNSFYEAAEKVRVTAHFPMEQLYSILDAFLRTIKNDLISSVSYERKLKIEVVNDYLLQAEELLEKIDFHPATVAFLIGSCLEEFLRNWINEQKLDLEGQKPSIDTYSKVLRKNEKIEKQELKEITVWAGLRNNAAHGRWELVEDRDKIRIMLIGVNLFIKKYSI
jgi:hypothetical protein